MKLSKNEEPSIPTVSGGRIKLRNLRPGDWLGWNRWGDSTNYCVVLQNSAVLGKYEVQYGGGATSIYPYEYGTKHDLYLGRGKKRKWWAWLPKCIQSRVLPYSKP
jgi:hypothetical protein